MKKIWIVNYYTSSNPSNPRYNEFSDALMKAGYSVTTFNSTTVEQEFKRDYVKELFIDRTYGNNHFIHVNSPKYEGNGLKRMMSIWTFAWRLFRHCKKLGRPDVVLHNLHTPFDFPIYWMAKRLKTKYIAEAWDLWPEDFVTFGLLSEKNPAMAIAYRIEKFIYEKADKIIFTFEGGLDYLHQKSWTTDEKGKINPDKVYYINNGVNISKFDEDKKSHPRTDTDLTDPKTYKIIYMGSIRLVNNVKQLIDAAAILQRDPKYQFFIYGDGTDREYLEQYVKEKNISNVAFKEKFIPLSEVAWVVSQATVNIMNYQKKFGLHGVSSGKMFQYFAAGRPICCNIKLKYSEISRRRLGIDRDLNTSEQYAEAIQSLAELPSEEYSAMCDRVRKTGEDFDYKILSFKELSVIEDVLT
jgi:glycosyltransferase involved in cell wall biosynthesis